MENKEQFSLILAIVNRGHTDLVMEAARKAGSTGGTIGLGRGTGNAQMAKKYGIVIQPEKEIVFIAVKDSIKDKVMKAIYDEAGLQSKGTGIVFSLPIIDEIGLTPKMVNALEKEPSPVKEEPKEVEAVEETALPEEEPKERIGTVEVKPIEEDK